ncbi:cysteine-rich CWC family protein [Accumulibacter sp.]|uniref:cysteine-rich CWC family protein n=1 Tax=Accumulibacter sp. TaxID=2053492 RepID=UPI00345882CB
MACAGCGESFVCGAAAGLAGCWCMAVPPPICAPATGVGCYCRTCLEKLLSAPPSAPAI